MSTINQTSNSPMTQTLKPEYALFTSTKTSTCRAPKPILKFLAAKMGLFYLIFAGLCGLVKGSVEKLMSRKPVEFSAENASSHTIPSDAESLSQFIPDEAQEALKVTNQTNALSLSHIVSPRAESSSRLALREVQKAPEVSDHTSISQIERTKTHPITHSSGPSSWEIKFDRNLRRSLLIRLPDELLLRIMQRLDTVDMYMLRQVLFTLWRIYQDKTFAEFHCPRKDEYIRASLWDSSVTGKICTDKETRMRAKETGFCVACSTRRKMTNFNRSCWAFHYGEFLFCSECGHRHPKLHFSHQQRNQSSETRKCIGSEGVARVCPHITISPSSLRQAVMNEEGVDIARMKLGDGFCFARCNDCRVIASSTLAKYDPTHMFSFTPWYAPRVMLKTTVSSRPLHGHDALQHSLGLHWCLPVFRVAEKEQVTDIRPSQELKAFGHEYGDLLCPHVTYDDGQLLRPFDPQSCSCLGTDSRVGAVSGAKSPVEGCKFEWWSCKALARENKRDKTIFIPFGAEDCHQVECKGCDTTYQWHRFEADVYLSRRSLSTFVTGTNEDREVPDVDALLDPNTYCSNSDNEMKHLLWCDDRDCRNGRHWIEYGRQLGSARYPW